MDGKSTTIVILSTFLAVAIAWLPFMQPEATDCDEVGGEFAEDDLCYKAASFWNFIRSWGMTLGAIVVGSTWLALGGWKARNETPGGRLQAGGAIAYLGLAALHFIILAM